VRRRRRALAQFFDFDGTLYVVRRRRRALAQPFDFDGTLYVLRDNLGRADANIAAANALVVQFWSDDDEESILRRRNRIWYFLEEAQLATQAAIYAGQELHLHRRDT
jgi:hypothetical protein